MSILILPEGNMLKTKCGDTSTSCWYQLTRRLVYISATSFSRLEKLRRKATTMDFTMLILCIIVQ